MSWVRTFSRGCGLLASCVALAVLACEDDPPQVTEDVPVSAPAPDAGLVAVDLRWPSPLAPLTSPELDLPRRGRKWRVYIDAGHGAPGNGGASSAFCEREQDFTLRVSKSLAERLRATGRFHVRQSRDDAGDRPTYPQRVRAAEAWRADVFLSLHMDARGYATEWAPLPGQSCWREDSTPGFAILWADDARAALNAKRLALARALAARMEASGFLAYDGEDYTGIYEGDEGQAGVFVSRHPPGRRIYVLRRPKVPSVIIETHHALDVRETTRWREPRTLEVFSDSVAAALADFLTERPALSQGAR